MFVGGYELHLYCDRLACPDRRGSLDDFAGRFESFAGVNQQDAAKKARDRGWVVGKKRHLCPHCAAIERGKTK